MKIVHLILGALLLLGTGRGFAADLKVAQPFQDHMVLQRQKPVPIWGTADSGKTITVKIGDKQATATVGGDGSWRVNLPAMEANSTAQAVTISDGTTTLTLNDVLIGEVWFCAGQSNMARTIGSESFDYQNADEAKKDADYPLIRYINYPNSASDKPLADMDPIIDGKATWVALSPTTAEGCMALPFFFARNLYKDLQVPIGLVQIAVAGTTQTAWASKETLDAQKTDGPRTYTYDDCFTVAEAGLAKGKGPFKSWREFADADTAWHANPTGRWPATLEIMDYPSVLYNALVHPLAPMAMRGMLWHQGEAGPAIGYGARMVAMVDQWRKLYEQDFYFIQGSMTRFTHVSPPLAPAFEGLRSDIDEQFLLSQTLFGPDGKSALCGFVDLGNTGTHWERKDEAGRRMAQAAMTIAYGKPAAYTGPQLIESTITGATIRCRFSNVGTGLKYEPSIDGISGFILHGGSGGQQTSVWVTPQIEGTDTLVFSDPSIPAPDNIYYAWAQNPHDTLFNSDGLPAYPFRLKAANDRSEPSPISMVTIVSQVDPKAVLHLSDVHRYAYVFSFLDNKKGAGSNTVKVYLPKEWAKPGASQDGKDFPLGDITPDAQGNRFAQVQIDTNASPLVIYDASKPDALVGANTQRN